MKSELAKTQKEDNLRLEKEAETERLRKVKEAKAAEDLAKQTESARLKTEKDNQAKTEKENERVAAELKA